MVYPLLLRMLCQPVLDDLRIRVTLHKSSVDSLGTLNTLSGRDDKLARLSLVEGSCESLLPVNDYIARLCDVLLDLLADLLTGLKARILHGENNLVGILLSKSSHCLLYTSDAADE